MVAAGNSFWCVTYILSIIQLCCCVSFLVVAKNCSQNENMSLQKKIRLLYYDLLANVFISYNLTLLYSVSSIYFFGLQQLLIFLVVTMQMNYLHVVSNTHLCQYPFSILWPEFLGLSDITLLCWMIFTRNSKSELPPKQSAGK